MLGCLNTSCWIAWLGRRLGRYCTLRFWEATWCLLVELLLAVVFLRDIHCSLSKVLTTSRCSQKISASTEVNKHRTNAADLFTRAPPAIRRLLWQAKIVKTQGPKKAQIKQQEGSFEFVQVHNLSSSSFCGQMLLVATSVHSTEFINRE